MQQPSSESLSPAQVGQSFKTEFQTKSVAEIRQAHQAVRSGHYSDIINSDATRCLVLSGLMFLLTQRQVSLVG
jgi:hypothetical protein